MAVTADGTLRKGGSFSCRRGGSLAGNVVFSSGNNLELPPPWLSSAGIARRHSLLCARRPAIWSQQVKSCGTRACPSARVPCNDLCDTASVQTFSREVPLLTAALRLAHVIKKRLTPRVTRFEYPCLYRLVNIVETVVSLHLSHRLSRSPLSHVLRHPLGLSPEHVERNQVPNRSSTCHYVGKLCGGGHPTRSGCRGGCRGTDRERYANPHVRQ